MELSKDKQKKKKKKKKKKKNNLKPSETGVNKTEEGWKGLEKERKKQRVEE